MSPDEPVPEPLPASAVSEQTGEVIRLDPEEAREVAAEIKAVAESRGEDSEVVELVEMPRRIRTGLTLPIPLASQDPAKPATPVPAVVEEEPPHDEDALQVDDLRDAWPLLDLDERGDGLRVLPREEAEEFFIALSAADQAQLLLHFRAGQRRQWMRLLEPDDVADVIQYTGNDPANRKTLLALLDEPTRKEVNALLAYAEDEAGGLMSTRYARLRPEMTADEAVSYLRRQARAKLETIYVAYVTDAEQHLLGVVSFRDLFAADPKTTVADIMIVDVVRVSDEMDQETVSRVFAEHDLNVIPVVDKDGRMKGIVTVDDIVDVVQEEATEDIQKFGGLEALDLPYLASSRREMIKKRARWLTILLVGEMLTATALGFFQKELDKAIVLSLFLPLIISSGGNSGSQASTLVIRAMALGEVRIADWLRVFRREIQMGIVLGTILGSVAAVRVIVWGAAGAYEGAAGQHFLLVGLTVAGSLVGCVMWGTLMGAMLPFALRKLGADPASASAPLVATLVDVSGIIIYFTIASLILTGTVIRSAPDACKVVDEATVAAAFGSPLARGPGSPHQKSLSSRCEYKSESATVVLRTQLTDSGSFEDSMQALPGSLVPVSGLGETAFEFLAAGQLFAYARGVEVSIGYAPGAGAQLDAPHVREIERALMTKILAGL
jgi:magnesium transporter